MAFVNKKSLRSEFDSLKKNFEYLKKDGKVPFETEILFKSSLVLFEVMIAVFFGENNKEKF